MSGQPFYPERQPPAVADRLPLSAFVLLATNLIPLVGVLLHDWTVFQVLLLYWCENVVVGVFNVLRMLCAQPRSSLAWVTKLFLIPFFTFHYGMFTLVHGIFVLALFGNGLAPGGNISGVNLSTLLTLFHQSGLGLPVAALVASHGFSFFHNYLAGGEYQRVLVPVLMFRPYGRVVVLHLTVLLGGFLVKLLGSPVVAVIFLIGLKTAIDLAAHLAERRKLSDRGAAGPAILSISEQPPGPHSVEP